MRRAGAHIPAAVLAIAIAGATLPASGAADGEARARCDRAALIELTAAGCGVLLDDTAAEQDPTPIWHNIDCESASRHRWLPDGGDPHQTASGEPQGNDAYRELRVLDGDDYFGERCELGWNDHRRGPTALYREGDLRTTFVSFRLPGDYPLASHDWQVVMQIKQSQPSANAGGTPVLELEAKRDRWRFLQSSSRGQSHRSRELWSAPAEKGTWTRFAFAGRYSRDPDRGRIRVYADLNGDGDAADEDERSPVFRTYTLKRETKGAADDDGIDPGESIPSHLRVGRYGDPAIDCPAPGGCAVDVDNVQVLAG